MKKLVLLSMVCGLALVGAGCGDNLGDDGMGSAGDPGPGSDDVPPPEPKLDATGTYRINSTFDIATNMPGTQGSVLNGLIAATDDPDDPMRWLLDQMIDQLPNGTLKSILQAGESLVAGYLNDKLTDLAPDLVNTLLEIGHRMADMTKHFGLNEKLAVSTTTDAAYIGKVTADGVRFTLDAQQIDLAFVDYNIDDATADGVLIQLENESRMLIGEHSLPLSYGKIVRMGLDAAIIPTIDPNAHNLVDLLDDLVDCQGVGQSVADSLGFGSQAFWASACLGGLSGAAGLVYSQIAAADSTLTFHLTGNARVSDGNGDHKVDKLQFGEWAGLLSYDATDTTLVQPASFVGQRM